MAQPLRHAVSYAVGDNNTMVNTFSATPAVSETLRQIRDEVTSAFDTITRHRRDVRETLNAVMEGRLTPAAAERQLVQTARALAVCTRRVTELAPSLGRGTGAETIRALAEARAVDTAEYLDLVQDVLRRWPNRAHPGTVISDAPGADYKPDPLETRTKAQFNQALRDYRAWAGTPSLEEMRRRCGGTPVKSTFSNALNMTDELPKLKVVTAVVVGCGGSEEDMQRFASAWRELQVRKDSEPCGGRPRRLRSVAVTRERPA